MATSRYRRRNTPRQHLRAAQAEYVDLDSVEIITPDSLKEGAIAELTPPESQQILPSAIAKAHVYVAPRSESFNEEIQAAAAPLSPSAGRLAAAVPAAIPVAMPVGSSSVSESVSFEMDDAYESAEDNWPEIESYDDGVVVADLSDESHERATVAIARSMPAPVTPVFEPVLEESEIDFEEVPVAMPIAERSKTRTTHDLKPAAEGVVELSEIDDIAETELEAQTTTTAKIEQPVKQRSVLFVPLVFALGLVTGLVAAQWTELEAFYVGKYQAWQSSQSAVAPMPGDEAPRVD